MEMIPVTLYYSERTHNYVSDLRRMLDVIGGYDAPLYHYRPHIVNGIREGVICQLTLRPRTTADGQRQPPRRFFRARRKHLDDGVQEAARIAMLRLARIHATDLAGTPYRLHPAGSLLDVDPWQSALEQEEDETVTHLARFAFAQAHLAERTATELQETHQALDSARERIAELEEAIHARDNDEEEDEDNAAGVPWVLALAAQPLLEEEEMAEAAEVAVLATPPAASPPSQLGVFAPASYEERATPEHTTP